MADRLVESPVKDVSQLGQKLTEQLESPASSFYVSLIWMFPRCRLEQTSVWAQLRFKILSGVGWLYKKRVLDFGCGNVLLLDFLKSSKTEDEYHGWDVSEKMISVARIRHPTSTVKVVDVLHEDLREFSDFFDYILISGVFYVKFDGESRLHWEWTKATLSKLWTLCRRGISVNFLRDYVEWKENGS